MKSSWRGYELQAELDQSGLSWALMLPSRQVLSALGIHFSILSFFLILITVNIQLFSLLR